MLKAKEWKEKFKIRKKRRERKKAGGTMIEGEVMLGRKGRGRRRKEKRKTWSEKVTRIERKDKSEMEGLEGFLNEWKVWKKDIEKTFLEMIGEIEETGAWKKEVEKKINDMEREKEEMRKKM